MVALIGVAYLRATITPFRIVPMSPSNRLVSSVSRGKRLPNWQTLAYVPQILRVTRDASRAEAIACTTWVLFALKDSVGQWPIVLQKSFEHLGEKH